jgi:hypothetical protein
MVFCDQGQGCYNTRSGESGANPNSKLTCDGHVPRKFIWECNLTCGCHMECGNRVVQKGMKVKVGVFWTGEKGWGVRTFEPISIGTFVFQYVGEVCSNAEVINRHEKSPIHGWYTLDLNANWKTEAGVNDNEALCIDGFLYGNVGRFVNHRCEDANLMDYPVKIESRDSHIYHVAFFAKRHVYALEELTWVINLSPPSFLYYRLSYCKMYIGLSYCRSCLDQLSLFSFSGSCAGLRDCFLGDTRKCPLFMWKHILPSEEDDLQPCPTSETLQEIQSLQFFTQGRLRPFRRIIV